MTDICEFCRSKENIRVPKAGIALGMGGSDYSFCEKCLTSMSADDFWQKIFELNGYDYPPILRLEEKSSAGH